MTEAIDTSEQAVLVTGNCLLIPCAVDPTSLVAEAHSWRRGVLPIRARDEVKNRGYRGIDESTGVADRVEAFSSHASSVLGLDPDAGVGPGATYRVNSVNRFHRVVPERAAVHGAESATCFIDVVGFDLMCAQMGAEWHGVLAVHFNWVDESCSTWVGGPFLSSEDLCSIRAQWLYENVRTRAGRVKLLRRVGEIANNNGHFVSLDCEVFDSPNVRGLVFPLTTTVDLYSALDRDLLVARELATTTTSNSHGSEEGDERRLGRARKDIIELSDDISMMAASRGISFLSGVTEKRYLFIEPIVSGIYADIVAAALLAELQLDVMAQEVETGVTLGFGSANGGPQPLELHRGEHFDFGTVDVEESLRLRRHLLWLNNGLLRLRYTETATQSRIFQTVFDQRKISGELERATSGLNALIEINQLQYQLNQLQYQLEVKAADDRAQARERKTDVGFSAVAVAALPPTLIYSVMDMWHTDSTLGVILLAVVVVTVLAGLAVWKRKDLPGRLRGVSRAGESKK